MANTKPYVAAALLCEKVLHDADGVASLIRIVDRFTIIVPKLPSNIAPSVELTGYFALKSGEVRGTSEITLKLRKPDGQVVDVPNKWPITLNGDEHGATVTLHLGLPPVWGLYWLELHWNGELLSSAPFRLVEAQESQPKPDK